MITATKSGARPKVRLQPFDDRVVILPKEEEQTMRGGLHIPDSARERPTQGEGWPWVPAGGSTESG